VGIRIVVPNQRAGRKTKGRGGTLKRSIAAIAALTFAQSLIATIEVVRISQLKSVEAALWGAVNATCYIVGLVVIVIEPKRKLIIPFYILAAAVATYLGTLLGKYLP
jgi:hypothetical protein